jgi:hypothetical protein
VTFPSAVKDPFAAVNVLKGPFEAFAARHPKQAASCPQAVRAPAGIVSAPWENGYRGPEAAPLSVVAAGRQVVEDLLAVRAHG